MYFHVMKGADATVPFLLNKIPGIRSVVKDQVDNTQAGDKTAGIKDLKIFSGSVS